MKNSELRAIFFDAGNTLVYPQVDELAEDLTGMGYPATVEDFAAAERVGKHRLDEWMWPQIRDGRVPSDVDRVYWMAYLHSLMNRIGAPEREHLRLIRHLVERFRDITFWAQVMPEITTTAMTPITT